MLRLAQIPMVSLLSSQTTNVPLPKSSLAASPFSPEFEALLHREMHHLHVPGLAVAIVDRDDTFSRVSLSLYSLYSHPLLTAWRVTALQPFQMFQ